MNINWKVTNIERFASLSDNNDVVTAVVWRCEATEEGTPHLVVFDGKTEIPFDNTTTFIEYTNLSEQQVLSWVYDNGVDKSSVESIVARQLQECKSPIVITSPPPWVEYHSPLEQ